MHANDRRRPGRGELAVVTGAAQGIGRAAAAALAVRGGYDVLVVDLREPTGGLREQIEASGRSMRFVRADVGEPSDVDAVFAAATVHDGPVTALVNSAAVFPRASALEMEYAAWMDVVATNLGGTFLMCRGFAACERGAGGGAIVNMTSGRAAAGAVGGSHYAASKGGVISLTRSLAREWAPDVRVNAVMPGVTDTAQPREEGISDEELYARGASIPLGRIGQPEDVASVVEFLLSDAARYMTGQVVAVNGGSVML